jgi:hypothetical protein
MESFFGSTVGTWNFLGVLTPSGTVASGIVALLPVELILLAWVLTLPACVILGSTLFAAGLFVVLRLFWPPRSGARPAPGGAGRRRRGTTRSWARG